MTAGKLGRDRMGFLFCMSVYLVLLFLSLMGGLPRTLSTNLGAISTVFLWVGIWTFGGILEMSKAGRIVMMIFGVVPFLNLMVIGLMLQGAHRQMVELTRPQPTTS